MDNRINYEGRLYTKREKNGKDFWKFIPEGREGIWYQ